MADMYVSVRIGRTVMEDVVAAVFFLLLDLPVNLLFFPEPHYVRLSLAEIGLHGEVGLRQVQCIFIIV